MLMRVGWGGNGEGRGCKRLGVGRSELEEVEGGGGGGYVGGVKGRCELRLARKRDRLS